MGRKIEADIQGQRERVDRKGRTAVFSEAKRHN